MSHVATLIVDPTSFALTGAHLARAADALPHPAAADWLSPGVAADIPFARPDRDHKAIAERVRAALAPAPIDVVVQPAAARRKRLFLADMDSTMIGQECIDELADLVGLKAHVAAITERAMRGEIDFEPALRERVALLAGLEASVVDRVIAERITLSPGARVLLATLSALGVHTVLVSGGFTLFTEKIAAMIGFAEQRANRLVIENGRFAGRVEEPILGREAKRETLLATAARLGLESRDALAVGDGANDLAMLAEAGLGVAYRAKPKVAAEAHARLDHADLTALLFAQGYREAEIVRPA